MNQMATSSRANKAATRKEKYKAQYQRTEANKLRKQLKHAKRFPNDMQTQALVGKS